ncbi:hypothetical protein N431DRAFT_457550 [Stipitochalara longipes BDJ]|nr:hypothetical protein N431DRAFT_457550 [Stipitochalara longipes BDJ]
MHLTAIHAAIGTVISLVASLRTPANLPNGLWRFTLDANGDTVAHSVDNLDQPDIFARNDPPTSENPALRTRGSVAEIEERCCTPPGAYCFGYYLNHPGVDQSAVDLENYLNGAFNDLQCSEPTEDLAYGTAVDGALVYLCVDAAEYCESFSSDDVRTALGEMDAACPAYMAGYYRFNTGESLQPKLIGKDNAGANICV